MMADAIDFDKYQERFSQPLDHQVLLELKHMNLLLARISSDLAKLTGPKPIGVMNAQPSKMDAPR